MRVVQREFQRHFHRYRDKTCEVYTHHGVVLGQWIPGCFEEKKLYGKCEKCGSTVESMEEWYGSRVCKVCFNKLKGV